MLSLRYLITFLLLYCIDNYKKNVINKERTKFIFECSSKLQIDCNLKTPYFSMLRDYFLGVITELHFKSDLFENFSYLKFTF